MLDWQESAQCFPEKELAQDRGIELPKEEPESDGAGLWRDCDCIDGDWGTNDLPQLE